MKNKRWLIILCSVLFGILFLAAAAYILWQANKLTLELENNGTITLEYGTETELVEQIATCRGTIYPREGMPVSVKIDGTWDTKALGTYEVTFSTTFMRKEVSHKGAIEIVDTTPPEIILISDPNHFTSPVGTYEEEGYKAVDLYDGDVTANVIREERDGKVYYTATDSHGNTTTKEREIIYKDVIAPVITLSGGVDYKHQLGQEYADPGFNVVDECDGDISGLALVEGTVDGKKAGIYTVTYRATDSSGNVGEINRIVTVADYQAPIISLNGPCEIYLKVGAAYVEEGYSASDSLDGDVTSRVVVSGTVDISKMGYNTITYSVTDSHGHTTSTTRKIFVYEKQAISVVENPGDKVIYLTFDDGPSKYTEGLLNTLDRYGVKATFFVTNQFPSYQYMIGEAYRRGHTIALHTYSHKYNEVYASEQAYYDDLSKINEIVKAQTGGFEPTIVRFPGGTSNTVSRHYCTGIMSALSANIAYHGYLYCDWNVSSGDAGGAKTSEAVANNVINGVQGRNVSVVLQHDITSFSTAAVDQIIFWGLQNGYTFLPMSEKTPMVHFNPQN